MQKCSVHVKVVFLSLVYYVGEQLPHCIKFDVVNCNIHIDLIPLILQQLSTFWNACETGHKNLTNQRGIYFANLLL